MAEPPIAVTGCTGELGGRLAARLAERGIEQRLVARDRAWAPDLPGAEIAVAAGYDDREGMTEALRGAGTLFLVSGRESANRVTEHASAVDATFTFARDHYATEEHIRRRGVAYTGEMDVVSDSVQRLTGHPAQTLPEYLEAHPQSYAHLRAA